ncbi:MAG: hypothetical protein AB7Y46_07600 [Armatimonadota bacterium]
MTRTTRLEIRNERTRQVIEQLNEQMERWTLEQLERLKATHRTRIVADAVFRKVICARKYLFVPKHSEEERFFLRLMLLYAVALRPGLQDKANEVAEYYSTNYPYEWTQSRISRYGIQRARDMILSSAESEFGETPMAAPLGFVYHHHKTLGIVNPADYGECYARAAGLVRTGHFTNLHQPWRERLGLHAIQH